MIPVQGKITETDYLQAQRLHRRARRFILALGVLVLILMIIAVFVMTFFGFCRRRQDWCGERTILLHSFGRGGRWL